MKTLFVLASVMVVLFLAVPNKVEAQKRKATKTTEGYGQRAANTPKTPDYRISNIKIVPFDSETGEFQEEIKPNDEREFFNAFFQFRFLWWLKFPVNPQVLRPEGLPWEEQLKLL